MRQRISAEEIKRLMEPEDPLAAVIESRQAARETPLMDAVLALMLDQPLNFRLSELNLSLWEPKR